MNNSNLTYNKRIGAFSKLGSYMREGSHELQGLVEIARQQNPWFSSANVRLAIGAMADNLNEEKLNAWLAPYKERIATDSDKVVGLVLAGNIPLVGFHDVLTALISGLRVQIKLSSDDQLLIPHLLSKLSELEPSFSEKIDYAERLNNVDIIIATGSNNTSRYFDYYFRNYPHIIRKNRNSIAILNGREKPEDITSLGHDIFDYFGLGCRNVSKIYIPKDYEIKNLFEPLEDFAEMAQHYKYHNNYEYNKSIYLVNGEKHYDNGFLLLKEDRRIASPLAVLYYERYDKLADVLAVLQSRASDIQCIVTADDTIADAVTMPVFPLGQAQCPALDDYADGVNTLEFLVNEI